MTYKHFRFYSWLSFPIHYLAMLTACQNSGRWNIRNPNMPLTKPPIPSILLIPTQTNKALTVTP